MKRIIVFLILILTSAVVTAQDLEEKLLNWMEANSKEQLSARLVQIKKKYTNSPTPIFLEAFLENDGARSVSLYKSLTEKYPKSKLAENAMIKVGQYHFMTESYFSARKFFEKFIDKYPKSKFIPKAKYFSALCLLASDNPKKAEKALKKYVRQIKEEPYHSLAQKELDILTGQKEAGDISESYNLQPEPVQQKSTLSDNGKYTIQVGAFSSQANAIRLKELMQEDTFQITIVPKIINNRKLYLVWVGSFTSQSAARSNGKNISERYGIKFRVVKK